MLFMQRPKSEFSPLLQNHHLFIRALRIEPMEHELQVVSPYTMPEKLIGDTLLSDQKLKRVTNIGSVTRVHKTRH